MAREINTSPRTFLRINMEGQLYTSSNTPLEGYEEIKLKNGTSTYHKKFSATDDGYLSYIAIVEKDFPSSSTKVKMVEFTIESDGTSDQITIPLLKQNGGMHNYAKNLATLLPNLDFSKKINVVPSRSRDARGYVQQNLFFNYAGETGENSFVKFAHMYGEKGDIPNAVATTSLDGSVKHSFEAQDKYLYNILVQQIERFKAFKSGNQATSSEPSFATANTSSNTVGQVVSTQAPTPSYAQPANDEDDLPF